jgi:hypothetical protein
MTWGRTAEQQRWYDEAERQEEERARGKRELRHQQKQDVATLEDRLSSLEDRLSALEQTVAGIDPLTNGVVEFSNAATRRLAAIEGLLDELERKLQVSIERRFGEAMGRIDALAPDVRSRSKEYKFANEREDEKGIVDLPNPLTPLVRKVTMN